MSVQGGRGNKVVCHPPCFSSSFSGILCCGVVFLQTTWQGSCILLHGNGRAKCHQARGGENVPRIGCNGRTGQLKTLAENLVPHGLSDLVQHDDNYFSEGDLPSSFSYREPEPLPWADQENKMWQYCAPRPWWQMRADLPCAIPAFSGFCCSVTPIYPAMAMSCRDLPPILCVEVEIAASRTSMVTAWGELSWHKGYRSASLAFGARCLFISGCCSNARSGLDVEKRF